MSVTYKFADGRGNMIEVVGPINDFLCQPNPYNHSHTKDKEGLIFIGAPDVIGNEAIFGMVCQPYMASLANSNVDAQLTELPPNNVRCTP